MNQEWFEMNAERRRIFSQSSWVPLRALISKEAGRHGHLGYRDEFQGVGTVAISVNKRERGEELNWHTFGIMHDQSSFAFEDGDFKPVDEYRWNDRERLGTELVLVQRVTGHPNVWHVNQDLVFALRLFREGDQWLCPEEDYACLIKLTRDKDGDPEAIHIRTDALRDYLAARSMALRINQYQTRVSVETSSGHIKWPDARLTESSHGARFEGRVTEIVEGGDMPGATAAVFRVSRTDDMDADVPELGPERDENTASERWTTHPADGTRLLRIEGEFWKDEWIDPAARSTLVRGDREASHSTYFVDSAATRVSADDLRNEDIGKWLWFDPRVILDLCARRGGSLSWYTRDTGSVSAGPGYDTHFGVNKLGFVNTYAYDVAKLPEWQRRIWAARSVFPDGGLSDELVQSQVRAKPASTRAPEDDLPGIMGWLNEIADRRWSRRMFQKRDDLPALLSRVHRFRAFDEHSLLDLAKDAVRITADLLDKGTLHAIAPPRKGNDGTGSLKSLERVVAADIGEERAHAIMAPLFGLYDLRIASAHLPSSDVEESYSLAGINRTQPYYFQAHELILAIVRPLVQISQALDKGQSPPKPK